MGSEGVESASTKDMLKEELTPQKEEVSPHERLQTVDDDGDKFEFVENFGLESFYDCFCRYARSSDAHNREIAILNFQRTLGTLDPDYDDESIINVYTLYETIFLEEADVRLRCILLEQIPSLFPELLRLKVLQNRPLWLLSTVLLQSLSHENEEVWKCTIGVIGQVVLQELISREVLEKEICPQLLKYAFDGTENANFFKDEHRLEVVTLLCQIIAQRGKLSLQWIYDEFTGALSRLLQDPATHIRKVCTSILGDLASMFGRPFTETFIVPFLVVLSEDLMWGVRKECCEVFVDVARMCSLNVRMAELAPCFIALLNDSSRWVCSVAYQNLGPFIVLFAETSEIHLEAVSEQAKTFVSNDYGSGKDAEEAYGELPAGVVLPPRKEVKQELDVITSLLDSWALRKDGTDDLGEENEESCGAAALCSTHTDLTKLFEADDDLSRDAEDQEERLCLSEKPTGKTEEDFGSFHYWNSAGFVESELEVCDYDTNSPVKSDSYFRRRFDTPVTVPAKDSLSEQNQDLKQKRSDISFHEADRDDAMDESKVENGRAEVVDYCEAAAGLMDDCEEETEQSESDIMLNQGVVPKGLLDTYRQMVSNCCTSESDINRHCAHNFPAVAYTLGRGNWLQIKDTYLQLASDIQWRVRQSLAASMHEVAAIIGEENSDLYLVPVFEQFMKDVEEVKFGILKHLFEFFKSVSKAMRRRLLTILATFLHSDSENEKNWRFRYEYTWQCVFLCDLYDVEEINTYIAAIALTLANDRIAYVRKVASYLLAKILGKFALSDRQRGRVKGKCLKDIDGVWKRICDNNEPQSSTAQPEDFLYAFRSAITITFVEDIVKGFAKSKNWRRRQTFSYFCENCIDGRTLKRDENNDGVLTREEYKINDYALKKDEFCEYLLTDFINLATDAVPNIRIAFSNAVTNPRGKEWFLYGKFSNGPVKPNLMKLMEDCEVDCRRAARFALGYKDRENYIKVNLKEY